MTVYRAELGMDAALRAEYLAWLDGHARVMLALPRCTGAEILIRSKPPPPAGRCVLQAHYRLRDRATRHSYLADHAPRMRRACLARFGGRIQASRTLFSKRRERAVTRLFCTAAGAAPGTRITALQRLHKVCTYVSCH